jgi:site-specific recombinase XerD
MLETHASATVRQRYASLKQWFGWLHREGEIPSNPIEGMEPPKIDEKPVPVIPLDDLRAILAACKAESDGFLATRDEAIIRLFIDTGVRLEEMAGIKTGDIDRRLQTVVVLGKGRRFRTVAFDVRTAEAVDRYDRQRKRNEKARDTDAFWIGRKGQLSSSAIAQMVKRRSADAGISPHIHPHQFRHTFAHQWLTRGGNEGDLQQIAGWSSPQMLQRYGSSAAEQRAQEAHKRIGLWDDL